MQGCPKVFGFGGKQYVGLGELLGMEVVTCSLLLPHFGWERYQSYFNF